MTKSSGFNDRVGDDSGDGDDNGHVDGDSGDGEDNGNVDDDDGLALVIGDKQAVAALSQGHKRRSHNPFQRAFPVQCSILEIM